MQEAISMKIEPGTNQDGHTISNNVLVISMSSPALKVDELLHIKQANH